MHFSDGPYFVSEVAGPSSSSSRLKDGWGILRLPSECVSHFPLEPRLVAIGSAYEFGAGPAAVPAVPWWGRFVLRCRVAVVVVH